MKAAINTRQLTKHFGDFLAVDAVDLEVWPGEIFGFLGPNGAGKTTMIMMLLGILRPTSGSVHVLGQEMSENALSLKARVGVVSEHQSLYGDMTAEEYLGFFATLYAVANAERRIGELLEVLDLDDRRQSRVKTFSRGMQQKLSAARALLHSPDLLVMDEPASGLDPYGISQMRELIYEHKRQGKTVFLSSHILSEIEQTANRVALIARGRIVGQGSVSEIRARLAPDAKHVLEWEGNTEAVLQALGDIPGLRHIQHKGMKLILTISNERDARADISRAVTGAGGIVLGLSRQEMSLEEAFLTVTDDRVRRLAASG